MGIVIGVLLLVFLGVVIVTTLFCLVKRRKTERGKKAKACYAISKLKIKFSLFLISHYSRCFDYSDNAVYGERVSAGRGNAFNGAREYEVPANSLSADTRGASELHRYHIQMGTYYDTPSYDYTSGTNGQEVITQLACMPLHSAMLHLCSYMPRSQIVISIK